MRFRLRYLHHDLELTEGQFVVGRSAGASSRWTTRSSRAGTRCSSSPAKA